MAVVTKIEFNSTINSSLQVGDTIYVSNVLSGGIASDSKTLVGIAIEVGSHYVVVSKNPTDPPIVSSGQFILFAKDIEINESSLKGYYADVTLENYSNTKTELFAISSEVMPSSK